MESNNSIVISEYKYEGNNRYTEINHNCFEVPVKNENYCKIVNEQGDLAVIITVGRTCRQTYEKTKQCWIDSTLIKLKGNADFFNKEKEKYYEINPQEKRMEIGDPNMNRFNCERNDIHFFKSQIKQIENLEIHSFEDLSITFIPKGEQFCITADDYDYGCETIYFKNDMEWLSA